MDEMTCPNCGHHLTAYQRDQQTAGAREVWLEWNICRECRHVALRNWSFAEEPQSVVSEARTAREPRRWRRRTRLLPEYALSR